jgi:aspartate racemase
VTPSEVLAHLRSLGVRVSTEGDRIRCDAPSGVLTPELRAQLVRHKTALLELLRASDTVPETSPITRTSRDRRLPMSFGQERLWFLAQLNPQSAAYNVPVSRRWQGPLDLTVLQRCLDEIVRRHEVLRTTLMAVDGEPAQVVHPPTAVPLPVVDLADVPEAEREAAAERHALEEAERPFDLGRGPLFRASLIRFAAEDHLLLLTMHHAVTDGWSLDVLAEELKTLYAAFSLGQPSPLPELPLQYADFAQWQRERLGGAEGEAQLAFWRRHLGRPLPTLSLPTDRPRPTVQSFRGATHHFQLSPSVADAVRRLGSAERATPFMVLLAGFAGLLHRYTGQDDIVVGTPVTNRSRVDLEPLIGFFVNTLALRTNASGQPTFRELVRRVRDATIEAYAHQDVPFERVVEALHPERGLGDNPLFGVAFALQDVTDSDAAFDVESVGAQFDLTLDLWMGDAGLEARFQYAADLFDPATIERMVGHLDMLLSGWLGEPDRPLAELPMLTVVERQQLLVEWNDTRSEFPSEACLHHLFEAQVERTPDAVALSFEAEQMTYRELDRRANQLAHYLRGLGVGPEVLVAICVHHSLEMVIGLLGIVKAGGAYVPLDPSYPKARLAFMLEDSHAPVLLTLAPLLPQMPAHGAKVVCLDTDWAAIAACPEEPPMSGTVPDSLVYVIYTSGSTGTPKGAMITHRGLVNYLTWCITAYAVGDAQGAPVNSPIAFDLTITSLFAPLLAGKRVLLFREDDSLQVLGAVMSATGDFSLIKLTPAHLDVLNAMLPPESPAGLTRALIIGGEALREASLSFWRAHAPKTRLINEYGPTETVVGCCAYEVPPGMPSLATVPIGRPIANTQIYLLDAQMEAVPIGVPGELYIGGAGLARGYLNCPALTAEKFVPSPMGDEAGARLYRTGDFARYRSDGNLEFLGRIDHQVKIRGFRVELSEIEAVLCQYRQVREAVVLARDQVTGDKHLVAYVVSDDKLPPTVSELQTFLRQRLPDYMVPRDFVTLDALPLTANGKVDRRALQAAPVVRTPTRRATPPRDSLEARLIEIWQNVLGVSPIGVDANFFTLGGTSLLAVRLFARIDEAFGGVFPLAMLFQAPTVERLAQAIREAERSAPRSSVVPIQAGGPRPPLFAVPGVGGDVVPYAELARRLGPSQPFYGLQSRGLDGRETPLLAIEAIAARYVEDLRAIQAVGPYFLLGACMGGVVAFEMARQLRAERQDVPFLGLVDTWPTQPGRSWRPRLPARRSVVVSRFLAGRLALHARAFAEHTGRARWAYVAAKLAALGRKVRRGGPFEGNRGEIEQAVVADANLEALQRYQPSRYDGPVTLFVAAARTVPPEEDQRLAWGPLVGSGLEVHMLPAQDSGLMLREPEVGALAEQLEACLRKAQAAPPR